MDFFLRRKSFLVVSVGVPDSDGQLFWECPHLFFVHIRESPEFRDLLLRPLAWLVTCFGLYWWGFPLGCFG